MATKTLRYINDDSNFNDTQMDVAENFFIEGTGAVIIEVLDGKIVPTQIRWEEFYADPYARRADFKDARYMGIAKWVDAEVVRQQYRVRIEEIGDPLSPQGFGFVDSFQDRPLALGWVDIKRRRVMLVEEYAMEEGEWKRIVYVASGVLDYGPSPYLDDKRRPCNPIEAESCYIDRENSRYGMVRDMVPIQDEINASRSRSLHLMNSRQVQNTDPNAPPVDDATVRAEASKADGVLPTRTCCACRKPRARSSAWGRRLLCWGGKRRRDSRDALGWYRSRRDLPNLRVRWAGCIRGSCGATIRCGGAQSSTGPRRCGFALRMM